MSDAIASALATPKVFISYSWTTPEHQQRVREWAERLLSDGVEVVIDVFDLKEGHDKYHFMERMVTDPHITHVLVVCDRAYSEKADAKKAGVGTESQIISSEVYSKVEQSKFIPIVCEFSAEREPSLPVFLKSRIWIDFSTSEAINKNWERLIRLLHGRPAYQKPAVGKPPAYLSADSSVPASPAGGKYQVFKHALEANSKNLHTYREDFLSACIKDADELRIRTDPGRDSKVVGERVLEISGALRETRNRLVDWVLLESGPEANPSFAEALLELLTELLELKARPVDLRQWQDYWFEAHAVFVYETFLYIVAALLRRGAYALLHEVLSSHYMKPESDRYGNDQFVSFTAFYGHAETLQTVLATNNQRLFSPAAELLKRQADRTDVPFESIIEAELLVMLYALISPEEIWFPQTMYYAARSAFPFFVRASQHRNFVKLATVLGVSDADDLRRRALAGYERVGVRQWPNFYLLHRSFLECMNLEKLDTLR